MCVCVYVCVCIYVSLIYFKLGKVTKKLDYFLNDFEWITDLANQRINSNHSAFLLLFLKGCQNW